MDADQQAVEWLTANSDSIPGAWESPAIHRGGCLFAYCEYDCSGNCGCLTEVRSGDHSAETRSLTEAIRRDGRIPCFKGDITPDHLPVFAQWQRHIDKVLGRNPPAMDARIPLPTVEGIGLMEVSDG